MKKLTVAFVACLSLVASVFAQDAEPTPVPAEQNPFQKTETRSVVPVYFALGGEDTIDVVGLRLSLWGKCHDLTGLDLAVGGEAQNAYGLQLALVRNKVLDQAAALQLALIHNSASYLTGVQIALANDALVAKGLQLGIINSTNDTRGLQIGLINSTDIIYGYQIGLINVIKGSAVPFFPILNFQLED